LHKPKHSSAKATAVKLSLMPAGRYALRSIIQGKDLGVFSAADLSRGVEIVFEQNEPVEVLEVTRASS